MSNHHEHGPLQTDNPTTAVLVVGPDGNVYAIPDVYLQQYLLSPDKVTQLKALIKPQVLPGPPTPLPTDIAVQLTELMPQPFFDGTTCVLAHWFMC